MKSYTNYGFIIYTQSYTNYGFIITRRRIQITNYGFIITRRIPVQRGGRYNNGRTVIRSFVLLSSAYLRPREEQAG